MKTGISEGLMLADFEPTPADFEGEVLRGLKRSPKTLPCKFLYDACGSQLFDQICELEEYYPTRTENQILKENITEMAELCGPECLLVELGSGSSQKTRLLLDHLELPVAYVPIDISRSHLMHAAAGLSRDYFPLEVLPICADYNEPLRLPEPEREPRRTLIFFPGSTIGNFEPSDASLFLRHVSNWCKRGDALLIGADLHKCRSILEPAYNDAKGVTAAFNLNLLHRINEELGANFRLDHFRHRSVYNEDQRRIEMHLVSVGDQKVTVAGKEIGFIDGEHITTEHSYKFCFRTFRELAARGGWRIERTWLDGDELFSVHLLVLE